MPGRASSGRDPRRRIRGPRVGPLRARRPARQAYRAALAGARAASAVSSRREAFELYRRAVAQRAVGHAAARARAACTSRTRDARRSIDDAGDRGDRAATRRDATPGGRRSLEAAEMLLLDRERRVPPGRSRRQSASRSPSRPEAELAALPPERRAVTGRVRSRTCSARCGRWMCRTSPRPSGSSRSRASRPRAPRPRVRAHASGPPGVPPGHRLLARLARRPPGPGRRRARDDDRRRACGARAALRGDRRDGLPERGRARHPGHGLPTSPGSASRRACATPTRSSSRTAAT